MQNVCAAFTMARDERLWLRIWLAYHSEQLGEENCTVLYEPGDETIEIAREAFPLANFIEQPFPFSPPKRFDEIWRIRLVEQRQREFLEKYKCVLFSDTDEFLVPKQGILKYCTDILIPSPKDRARATGYTIVQRKCEPSVQIGVGKDVLNKRARAWRSPLYDKTIIVKASQTYSKGFHLTYEGGVKRVNDHCDINLPLLHMSCCDMEDWMRSKAWRYAPPCTLKESWEYFQSAQSRWVNAGDPHCVGNPIRVKSSWRNKITWR